MKKYKVYWSIFNLFTDTQSEVVKLQNIVKGIMGAGIVTTWASTNATYGIILALGAGAIDILLGCLYFEEIKREEIKHEGNV